MTDIRKFMNIVEGVQTKTVVEWGGLKSLLGLGKKAQAPAPGVDLSRLDRKAPAAATAVEPASGTDATFVDHAPPIGMEFTYRGRSFIVMGYMREDRPAHMSRGFGKRNAARPPLVACMIKDATWVHGMGGGAGCVAPISDIKPTGRTAPWSEEQRHKVEMTAGQIVANGYSIAQPDR